jgi:hypothetical protein
MAMSVEHAVEAFAGFMMLLSVMLTVFASPAWIWLIVFVGFNLFQQCFTGLYPATFVMKKVLGLKTEA